MWESALKKKLTSTIIVQVGAEEKEEFYAAVGQRIRHFPKERFLYFSQK